MLFTFLQAILTWSFFLSQLTGEIHQYNSSDSFTKAALSSEDKVWHHKQFLLGHYYCLYASKNWRIKDVYDLDTLDSLELSVLALGFLFQIIDHKISKTKQKHWTNCCPQLSPC